MRIKINGTRLYFDVNGVGLEVTKAAVRKRPTMIVLHGAPGLSDHTAFKPLLDPLLDVAQIVYLDLSGAGRSDNSLDGTYSLDKWADELVAFCDALEIDKPVIFGNSAGGMVAAAYAIRHPEHPGRLILSSTQAKLTVDRCLDVFERLGGTHARSVAQGALAQRATAEATAEFGKVCNPLYNPTRQPPGWGHSIYRKQVAAAFHQPGGIWHTMDLLDQLHNIACPTLIMAGSEDPITPLADSEDIAARIDPALLHFEVFQNAGHGVWKDSPEQAFDVLRTFIASANSDPPAI